MILLMRKIWEYYQNYRLINAVINLGQKSLQVYIMSCVFLSVLLPKIFDKIYLLINSDTILVNNFIFFNFVLTLLIAVMYAILLYKITILLEKYKIGKIIFGR